MMNGRQKSQAISESGLDLRARTKRFSLSLISLHGRLPERGAIGIIKNQLLRSGTSIGAQYREACRARSTAEFISKMESSLQELDETGYWLELLLEAKLVDKQSLDTLMTETDELIRIFVASVHTAKERR